MSEDWKTKVKTLEELMYYIANLPEEKWRNLHTEKWTPLQFTEEFERKVEQFRRLIFEESWTKGSLQERFIELFGEGKK